MFAHNQLLSMSVVIDMYTHLSPKWMCFLSQVRLQTQEAGKQLYRGTYHCLSTIVKQEGVFKGLYKGLL